MGHKGKKNHRLYRYWFADRGIGKPSRAATIAQWLTLKPLRQSFFKTSKRFFAFKAPEWSKGVGRVVYSPSSKYRWHDYVNPIYWMVWSIRFAYAWLISRPYTSLGPGLPAIVVMVVLGVFVFRQNYERSNWRSAAYREHLSMAFARQDDATARVVLMNLVSNNPGQIEYRIQQALLEEKLGNEDTAAKTMASLAFDKKNSLAAYWLVNKYYPLKELEKWDSKKRGQFQELMAIVFKDARGKVEVEARTMMAQYYLAMNLPTEALRMLEVVAPRNQELLLLTASIHSEMGNAAVAKQWAERAAHYYEDQLLRSTNSTEARLNLAKAMILLNREEETARMLGESYKLLGDAQLLQASGEAYAILANRIAATETSSLESLIRRLRLLKQAIDAAPTNAVVLESLIHTTIQCADISDDRVQELREALLQNLDSESVHFVQGTVDLLRGNVEQAHAHFERIAANKKLPGVLNNMAVVLHEREPPDLERALNLSNAALELMPDFPAMRETRGQILVKMNEYEKAIPDLEFALQDRQLAGPVHRALAEAHEGLGQKQLAEEHRALADMLQK